jgi:serine/threonine protein kinase/tetratricopeptide (TPR) repeat protein
VSTPGDELVGATLDRWNVQRRLGEGAMGPVFEVVSTGGTKGALHVVRAELVAGADRLERFRRDAKTFQKLEHQNVPRVLDVGEALGHVFVTFELVEGRSLQFRLDKKEPLTPAEGRNIATDVLSALAALHDRGIVHGDVKPASILSGSEGYWKLTGFSLVAREATAPGAIRGTPLFMAPERCQGRPESVSTDLYSAGATIFASLAGEPPFLRPSVAAIMDAHVNDPAPDLGARVPGAEKDVVQLVRQLMAKTPDKRPADARTALAIVERKARPRSKTQQGLRVADLAASASAADTLAGPPLAPPSVAPPAPPGTTTTRRKAHELVALGEKHDGARDPGAIPWKRAIAPVLVAGLLVAAAFAPSGLSHLARVWLAGASVASFLLGVLLVLAGTVPPGIPHHAAARTLLDRLPLRLAAWWNRRRDRVRAGLLRGQLGDFDAGEVLLDAGEPLLAAEEFLKAGIPLAAAIVFEKVQDASRAIDAYIAADKPDEASRVAAESGKLDEAGQAFEAAGYLEKALQAYGRTGNEPRLAAILERQEKFAEAARHYELANELQRAAELYEKGGAVADAARVFHRLGDLARVAAVWEAAGDTVNAARWRAERELAEGRQTNAAREFERAGMHGRAADLFLAQNLLPDAIRCAEADGDPSRKALLYSRTGDFAKAAAFHTQVGKHREAARCFHELGDAASEAAALERAGDPLGAGEAWLAAGKLDAARRILSSVPKGSADRRRALARLGEVESRAGRPREAALALAEALEGESPGAENVVTFVECADALAACGEIDRAIEQLARLRGLPFAPPTLGIRLAELERKKSPKGAPATPASTRDGKQLVGCELDRYKTIGYVGEGEIAWAFEAEHLLLKRSADLRILKPWEEELSKQFFAESRALALAAHPNLPEVHDAGRTAAGFAYVALETARDPSLRQLLRQARGPLPVWRAATIGAGVLAGLAAAHEAGIVHGDVKPENVLVAPGDQARVVAFAFARHAPPVASATATHSFRNYASPEQAAGEAPTPASDQYSLAMILYEMLSGKHPAPLSLDPEAAAPASLRPLGEAEPSVPAELAAAVMKALEKTPALRFADAEELRSVVARFATA